MADIAEPLQPARILATPKRFLPFRDFSCGRKGKPWEKMVNDCVRDVYLGRDTQQTVIVVEDADSKLIGLCCFQPHPLVGGEFIRGAHRIHVVGTDRLFRGKRLDDGSRPGDVVLSGALEQIKIACDGRVPYLSALVSPENDRSHALFDRHGFGRVPYVGEGEIIRILPPPRRALIGLWPSTGAPDPMVRRIVRRMPIRRPGQAGS